jgi:hypothetical protein
MSKPQSPNETEAIASHNQAVASAQQAMKAVNGMLSAQQCPYLDATSPISLREVCGPGATGQIKEQCCTFPGIDVGVNQKGDKIIVGHTMLTEMLATQACDPVFTDGALRCAMPSVRADAPSDDAPMRSYAQ